MIRSLLARARSIEGRRAVALAALVLFVVCLIALSAHAAFEGPDEDCVACSALASLTVPLFVFVVMLLATVARERRAHPAHEPVLSFEPRRIAAPRGPPVL